MKALVLLALLSGLSGASGAVLAAGEKPPPLLLTGELQPVATVKVYARAAGAVIKVHVRESYPITEGQVLAEIDPREYEIEVAEAKAALETAMARLEMADAGGRPEERARASAEISSAEAVVRDAAGNYERLDNLYSKGGISKQSVDAARRELDVARARLVSASKSAALVTEGVRTEERRIARAEVEKFRQQHKMAELKLSYCKVKAPFGGVLGQRLVDEGAFVLAASSPQAPAMFVLSDSRVMKGLLDIPETQLLFIRKGAKAKVWVQTLPDKIFQGTVVNVYPYVDSKTRNGKVELAIPNPIAELVSGNFIKAEVESSPTRAASLAEVLGIKLPAGAIE